MDTIFPLTNLSENGNLYLNRIPTDINNIIFKYIYGSEYVTHLQILNMRVLDVYGKPVIPDTVRSIYQFYGITYSYKHVYPTMLKLLNIYERRKKYMTKHNQIKLFIIIMWFTLFRISYNNISFAQLTGLMNAIIDRLKYLHSYYSIYSRIFISKARFYKSHATFQIPIYGHSG